MVLLGVIVILGILLWKIDSRLEWDIPLKGQMLIRVWRERFSSGVYSLNIWYSEARETELEKYFWRLQKELPRLRKKFRVPLWIKVHLPQSPDTGKQNKYLACLRRRFPDIEIEVEPLCEEVRNTFSLSGENEHEERGIYAIFPDIK